MPTITLNKAVLLKRVGKLSDEKLKYYISYLGTDLDNVEGNEIIVEVFPNRPDLLSEQGFARALSSFIGKTKGLSKFDVKKSGEKVIIEPSVNKVRPFTACAIVKNLKFTDEKIIEIINVQEKLHLTFGRNRRKVAIGIYPMEKIKTPIYYRALQPNDIRFVPLESWEEMSGNIILEKHPKGREYAHLLEGQDKYPVFMDADEKVLSMPPIINSHDVGKIGKKTKDVFIECSGHDLKTLQMALNMLVTTLADMGGKVYSMDLMYGNKKVVTPNLKPWTIKVDVDYVNKKLGLELNKTQIKELLGKMGYGYEKEKALVPAYRADIMHQIDIVEDIAIAYGYDNFRIDSGLSWVRAVSARRSYSSISFLTSCSNKEIGFLPFLRFSPNPFVTMVRRISSYLNS
ncbi:phenylalanine--tRNA ligase subunit beta [Nanoarchaeota archaeon]